MASARVVDAADTSDDVGATLINDIKHDENNGQCCCCCSPCDPKAAAVVRFPDPLGHCSFRGCRPLISHARRLHLKRHWHLKLFQ